MLGKISAAKPVMGFGGLRVLADGVQKLDACCVVVALLHVSLAARKIGLSAVFAGWEQPQGQGDGAGDD